MTWIRAVRRSGWPAALGLLACVAGLLMLAASLAVASHAKGVAVGVDAQPPGSRPVSSPMAQPRPSDLTAAGYETHLDDVALIFALAADHGVTLGSVDYGTEASSSLPILVRTMDLRLGEDYSRFKPFVADLLARLPHLYLREIRIDRGNAEASKAQIALKLALVYRNDGQAVVLVPRTASSSSSLGAQP